MFRKVVRRIGRPLWKRIRPPIYTRIDWRIYEYAQSKGLGSESNASLQQLVPSFLNAVSTVQTYGRELRATQTAHASDVVQFNERLNELSTRLDPLDEISARVDHLGQSLGEVWDRIETMRREIMFEMRYAQASTHAGPHAPTAPEVRVVSDEKITAAKMNGAIKLNLGCGHLPLDGYINVDMRELLGVDIVAEVGCLPFQLQSVNEISSAHLLEHFPQEELSRRLLPYWRSLLVDGGRFHAVTPDGRAMLAGVAAGTYSWEEFREVLFGGQDYEGDFHYNLFTPQSLSGVLERAGFRDVRIVDQGRRNGKCFEFEITATK